MLQADTAVRDVARKAPIRDSKGIGKTQLCVELGWTRPKLDRILERDPHFPILWRGGEGRGRGWGFNLDTVQDYLATRPESAEHDDAIPESTQGTLLTGQKRAAEDESAVTRYDDDARIAEHYGERTARSRRDEAQAALLEDKLRKDRAQLVETEDLKSTISQMLMHLGKGLDALPDQIIIRLNLPAEHSLTIRDLINQLRTSMVADLRGALDPHA
jgi:phage terminase Nu1 subunit (DNA packaging protein)